MTFEKIKKGDFWVRADFNHLKHLYKMHSQVLIRGVTIHRYYRYNVWRYDASMPRVKYRYLSYKRHLYFVTVHIFI